MADKKVTALTSLTAPTSADLLMIIDDPSGTPVSKQITLKNLAGGMPNTAVSTLSVSANTTINGSNTVVSSNVTFTSARGPRTAARYITVGKSTGTVSNNATTELGGGMQGSILFDENYIYVANSNKAIKRVALSVFAS